MLRLAEGGSVSLTSSEYARVIELSERVSWKLDEVFPEGASLDFGKPFMPGAMSADVQLPFLTASEALVLNQIYGNSYAWLFYFVEAYIVEMAMQHAQAEIHRDDLKLRALLRFAEEEVKHQQMFLRFRAMFDRDFGSPVDLVDSPQAVARVILARSPMAVLLVTLHLELITQSHFVDCIQDSGELDPLFQSLFRRHWVEEAQHAKLDAMEIVKLRREADAAAVQTTIDDYFAIAGAFAGLLEAQAKLDVSSLARATGRTFSSEQVTAIEERQRRSYHRTFLRSGVTNAQFVEFLGEHFPAALAGARQAAVAYA
jgi:hypothetical protein